MGRKVSDGQSIKVTAPTGGVVAGTFYYLNGMVGMAFDSVDAGDEVALNIEQAEYETSQILTTDTMAVGTLLYFDTTNKRFTQISATGHIKCAIVTVAKDASNVVWLKLLDSKVIVA